MTLEITRAVAVIAGRTKHGWRGGPRSFSGPGAKRRAIEVALGPRPAADVASSITRNEEALDDVERAIRDHVAAGHGETT